MEVTTKRSRVRRPPERQPVETINIPNAMLQLNTVCALTGLSSSTIKRWVISGEFPPPVQLASRIKRWHAAAIRQWLDEHNQPIAW